MKAKTLVAIGLLVFCSHAWGQDSLSNPPQPLVIRDPPSKVKVSRPLVILKVDGRTCAISPSGKFLHARKSRRTLKKLNADWIQSIDVIKGKEATDKYGEDGKNGVLVLHMKDGTYDSLPRKLKRRCN